MNQHCFQAYNFRYLPFIAFAYGEWTNETIEISADRLHYFFLFSKKEPELVQCEYGMKYWVIIQNGAICLIFAQLWPLITVVSIRTFQKKKSISRDFYPFSIDWINSNWMNESFTNIHVRLSVMGTIYDSSISTYVWFT